MASHSKLPRAPFDLSTNTTSAAASFLLIVDIRASASNSGHAHVNQLGFKVGSCCSFHEPSCVKYSRALRHVPSSQFVKCASRKRAAPRSQLVEAAASKRRPALRVVLRLSYIEDTAVAGMEGNTVALQAPEHTARQRSNPSVNRRANGIAPGPRGGVGYHPPHGPGAIPSSPGYLKR